MKSRASGPCVAGDVESLMKILLSLEPLALQWVANPTSCEIDFALDLRTTHEGFCLHNEISQPTSEGGCNPFRPCRFCRPGVLAGACGRGRSVGRGTSPLCRRRWQGGAPLLRARTSLNICGSCRLGWLHDLTGLYATIIGASGHAEFSPRLLSFAAVLIKPVFAGGGPDRPPA